MVNFFTDKRSFKAITVLLYCFISYDNNQAERMVRDRTPLDQIAIFYQQHNTYIQTHTHTQPSVGCNNSKM